jgi:predicted CoA-binding protein
MKKTLVLGASLNPDRYSNKAISKLLKNGIEVCALGLKSGEVHGVKIETEKINFTDIHTITLYLGEQNQEEYYDYILKLNPQRVIFNPGTYNFELIEILKKNNIEVVEECTLIMLSYGDF